MGSLDTVGAADLIEAVDPVSSGPAITIFWQVSELNTVIGSTCRGSKRRLMDVPHDAIELVLYPVVAGRLTSAS